MLRLVTLRTRSRAFSMRALLCLWVAFAGIQSLTGCALFGGDEAFDVPISVTKAFDLNINTSSIPGAGAGVASPIAVEIPISAIDVDLAGTSQKLDDNKGKLKSIKIDAISITPSNNTLSSGSLPSIQLFLGPLTGQAGQPVLIATIPSIGAGQTSTLEATIDATGMSAAQPYLRSLGFSFDPAATISPGQTIPGGGVDLNISLKITAVIDPTQ
jgi:hypothetical protein